MNRQVQRCGGQRCEGCGAARTFAFVFWNAAIPSASVVSAWPATDAAARPCGEPGDGRLGAADAEELFELIATDGHYSALEKKTLRHIRAHFRWTPQGDATFRSLVRRAAARGWDVDGLD